MLRETLNRKNIILSTELMSFIRQVERDAKQEGVNVDFDYTPDCLIGYLQITADKAVYDYEIVF